MPFDNGSHAPLLAGRYETSKKLGANGLALGPVARNPGRKPRRLHLAPFLRGLCDDSLVSPYLDTNDDQPQVRLLYCRRQT
jgi:hypothetical protein